MENKAKNDHNISISSDYQMLDTEDECTYRKEAYSNYDLLQMLAHEKCVRLCVLGIGDAYDESDCEDSAR